MVMKNFIFFVLLLVSSISTAMTWETSFENAQKTALGTNKFLLVDFWANWCGPCKKMDADAWSKDEVKFVMESYVPVKIDIDKNPEIASRFGITSIPNMFILDANGKIIHQFSGYHTAKDLLEEIEKYTLSTEFLSLELINFYKSGNSNTGIRLAQKYFDYSLLVDKNVKNSFVNLGGEYLNEAKKKLNKKDTGYAVLIQRIALFEIYENLYTYDFEKVNKRLEKLTVKNKVEESNQVFYYFLKYTAAKGMNAGNLHEIQQQFTAIEGHEALLEKAAFILNKKTV